MKKLSHKVLAIIPARGGSKTIPNKNINFFNGYPLIAYSIAAGLKAKAVDRVIVSTDSPKIADVARYYGAEVPFLRPEELAQDDTTDLPVFEHALYWLEKHEGYRPDIIVQLRPTSPLRPAECIDEAITLLLNSPLVDCVRAVTLSGQNPYKMWHIRKGFLIPIIQTELIEAYNMPRQKLPVTFWQAGHIEAIRYNTIIEKHSMSGKSIMPLIIDPGYAMDLDTSLDWEFAEWALSRGNLKIIRPDIISSSISDVRMLVLDFDGVFTDNRVYITDDGRESVACSRGDGLGLAKLREFGVEIVVISTETNPVVSSRCKKLNLTCYQGVKDKIKLFKILVSERDFELSQIIYLGNDVNDLECMRLSGWSVAVRDAHREVLKIANMVLSRSGGKGAIRELCDLIISAISNRRKKNEKGN